MVIENFKQELDNKGKPYTHTLQSLHVSNSGKYPHVHIFLI